MLFNQEELFPFRCIRFFSFFVFSLSFSLPLFSDLYLVRSGVTISGLLQFEMTQQKLKDLSSY